MIVHLMLLLVQWLPLVVGVPQVSVDLAQNVHNLLPAVIKPYIQILDYVNTSNFISTMALG